MCNESVTMLVEDIKTAVAVSETNKEEEIAKVRQQCQQEIKTMQALLRGKLFVLRECNESLVVQVEDIKTAVAMSETYKEEEIAKVRQQCQQEIETNHHVSFTESLRGELFYKSVMSPNI